MIAWHDLTALGVISPNFPLPAGNSGNDGRDSAICRQITQPQETARILTEYSDVFSDAIKAKPMKGPPMKIELKDGARPRAITTARATPLAMRPGADKVITELLSSAIIEKVGENEPTTWCSPGFFVPKKLPKVRLVTDFTQLNKWVKRPIHPFPSVKDILNRIPADAAVFAKFDAVSGYHQLELDEESRNLTVFLLESGRYRYKRAPMGLSASSDEWCRRSDELIIGLDFAAKIVDDVICWGRNLEELWPRVRIILNRARQWNITLSKSKFGVGDSVFFAGCIISKTGIYPDPEKTKSIREFPTPKNTTDLRSFLGLAQQLGHYVPDLAHLTAPLRPLLKKETAWNWIDIHDKALLDVKKALTGRHVLKPFDPKLTTLLLTDASRLKGIGWALIQTEENGHRLVQCGSRGLTSCQGR